MQLIGESFVINKPLSEMTKDERDYLRYELDQLYKADMLEKIADIQKTQKDILEQQKKLKNMQVKSGTKLLNVARTQENHEKEINNQKKQFEKLKRETNVLSSQSYKSVRNKFMNKAKARVYALLGGNQTPEFILFSHSFFQKIYSDIAKEFNLDTWDSIPMDDYQALGSFFKEVERYRDTWYPNKSYSLERYNDLIKKRDNGFLPPERCRALTAFSESIKETKKIRFLKEGRF